MKEATGEVSMTVVTLVAIGVIGAILATMWGPISNSISSLWGNGASTCGAGEYYDQGTKSCRKY